MRCYVQFSIAQVLWLIFWVAMLFFLWGMIAYADYNPKQLGEHIVQTLIAASVMFFVAGIGATKGRPKMGAVAGLLAALVAVWVMAPWIY